MNTSGSAVPWSKTAARRRRPSGPPAERAVYTNLDEIFAHQEPQPRRSFSRPESDPTTPRSDLGGMSYAQLWETPLGGVPQLPDLSDNTPGTISFAPQASSPLDGFTGYNTPSTPLSLEP